MKTKSVKQHVSPLGRLKQRMASFIKLDSETGQLRCELCHRNLRDLNFGHSHECLANRIFSEYDSITMAQFSHALLSLCNKTSITRVYSRTSDLTSSELSIKFDDYATDMIAKVGQQKFIADTLIATFLLAAEMGVNIDQAIFSAFNNQAEQHSKSDRLAIMDGAVALGLMPE